MSLRPAKRCEKEQVLECLEAMRKPDQVLPLIGQREHDRHVVRGEAQLMPMSRTGLQDEPLEAHLRDVSFGGLGFVVSRPLCTGSHWRINFLREGYSIGEMGLIVRYCHAVNENVYLVGGSFIAVPGLLNQLGVSTYNLEKSMHSHCDTFRSAACSESFAPPGEVA